MTLAIAAVSLVPLTGCTLDSLLMNAWTGFGFSIGALPGNTVANLIASTLGIS